MTGMNARLRALERRYPAATATPVVLFVPYPRTGRRPTEAETAAVEAAIEREKLARTVRWQQDGVEATLDALRRDADASRGVAR